MNPELENKICWLYHKTTKEPLPFESGDDILVDSKGNFLVIKNGNFVTYQFPEYELRYHRKNISFTGLNLDDLIAQCQQENDNEINPCIWDEWKLKR